MATQVMEILNFAKQRSKGEDLIFPAEHDEWILLYRSELADLMDKTNIPLYFEEPWATVRGFRDATTRR